ncbi:MAG TPA: hypothetical protein VD866_11840 [Urbifossiella sp.]|nr:hypothetical protein [Urbifossiella sp.]
MKRVVCPTLLVVVFASIIACSGAGDNRRAVPTTHSDAGSDHPTQQTTDPSPGHDDAAADEARARWLADARASKKAELERLATAAEGKAEVARQAQLKAYRNNLAYAKQQELKKEVESLAAVAKKARDAVAGADTYEPLPPADDRPVATIGHASGGSVHVKGYYRKDGSYVPPHTRSAPRR